MLYYIARGNHNLSILPVKFIRVDNQLKTGYIINISERRPPLDEAAAGYKSEVASSANARPKTGLFFSYNSP
jgi:hypothetical protein